MFHSTPHSRFPASTAANETTASRWSVFPSLTPTAADPPSRETPAVETVYDPTTGCVVTKRESHGAGKELDPGVQKDGYLKCRGDEQSLPRCHREQYLPARHVILLLSQFVNYIEVTQLPVYSPSEQEKEDPSLYAENVRNLMAREGSLVLVGGDPGIGKSTLLLQLAALIAKGNDADVPARVLYVSGEEVKECTSALLR
ncbi:hypothetical protein OROGR_023274 [Orobanche gracilis]